MNKDAILSATDDKGQNKGKNPVDMEFSGKKKSRLTSKRSLKSKLETLKLKLQCNCGQEIKGRLDTSSLLTFLYEVMAMINSQPLTCQCLNDPKSLKPITPNRLLTMKRKKLPPPPGNFVREDV
ncbi:hypothetical protein ACROYT_G015560 [Oculina patagonica]